MKRPRQETKRGPLGDAERVALASKAEYIGSGEHKDQRWWGGLPSRGCRPKRQKTTICPLVSEVDRNRATEWIRRAIELGQCTFFEADKDFPKHVWYEENGQGWFGYCTNGVLGHYKGWPLEEEELREYLG